MNTTMNHFLEEVSTHNQQQPLFLSAVKSLAESVWPVYIIRKDLLENRILDRMVEPERQLVFRVTWVDDNGEVQVNRGYRIQYNSALGPYKGGMRFHSSVNQLNLKTLGFEQIIKNSLTGLNMGSGTGGSDFDPQGKSDAEIMRFCKSLMMELYRHIGPNIDVPARDLGVGEREIGYMFGAYNRISNSYTGVFTGRSTGLGGSYLRTEAAGYGCVYFAEEMLQQAGDSLEGKTVALSGLGNVAQHAGKMIGDMGGRVVAVSDSEGFLHDPSGIKDEKWTFLMALKKQGRGPLREYARLHGGTFHEGKKPWGIPCQVAMPCATLYELDENDAAQLIRNGCQWVVEGANLATVPEAVALFQASNVSFAPGKAAGTGGTVVSGFEMSQTSQRLQWQEDKINSQLQNSMKKIHALCCEHGQEKEGIDYKIGADRAGFLRVANAMVSRGLE